MSRVIPVCCTPSTFLAANSPRSYIIESDCVNSDARLRMATHNYGFCDYCGLRASGGVPPGLGASEFGNVGPVRRPSARPGFGFEIRFLFPTALPRIGKEGFRTTDQMGGPA